MIPFLNRQMTAPEPDLFAGRMRWVDGLRGVAMLLMLGDHIAATAGVGGGVTRLTITRLALPLFMALSGYVLAYKDRPSTRRIIVLTVAATIALLLVRDLEGMAGADVLLVYLVALIVWPWVRKHPLESAIVGLGTASALPVLLASHGIVWDGYWPGLLIGWMAFGAMWRRLDGKNGTTWSRWLKELGDTMPTPIVLLGQVPVLFYVGHLAVLAVVR